MTRPSGTGSIRAGGRRKAVTVPVRGTALLLIDVINDLAFEGSEALVAEAERMAVRLGSLKRRTGAAGIPTIYVNDNFGQWRSDFRKTVAHRTDAVRRPPFAATAGAEAMTSGPATVSGDSHGPKGRAFERTRTTE